MIIRQAKLDELVKIAEIYQREGDLQSVTDINREAAEYYAEIGQKRIVWFAEIEGKVIGTIQLILKDEKKGLADGQTTAELHHLKVGKGYQGQDIAHYLIKP